MRKTPLVSRSPRARAPVAAPEGIAAAAVATAAPSRTATLRTWLAAAPRDPRFLWGVIGLLFVTSVAAFVLALQPRGEALTQERIDAAVMHTLENNTLPSAAAKAYEAILPSVVQVISYVTDPKTLEEKQYGVGTGVVIVDKGIILTNFHVVHGAQRIKVVFFDGLESEAYITGV
jgi:S1-C subfamily serine protease